MHPRHPLLGLIFALAGAPKAPRPERVMRKGWLGGEPSSLRAHALLGTKPVSVVSAVSAPVFRDKHAATENVQNNLQALYLADCLLSEFIYAACTAQGTRESVHEGRKSAPTTTQAS